MEEKCILNSRNDCVGYMRAEEVSRDLDELKGTFLDLKNHNEKSHKEIFDRLAYLETHVRVQDAHYEHIIDKLTNITDELAKITEKISSVSSRITTIEMKPAKKWEGMAEKILWMIVAAGVTFVLTKIGLSV